MADAPRGGAAAAGGDRGGARGGFGSRGGDRGGDRGRGRGGRRGPRRGGNKSEEKEWQPVTKLGRLVKANKIKSMEEIYLHSLPIKEYQIVDFFLPKLKDEVMKVSGCLLTYEPYELLAGENEEQLQIADSTYFAGISRSSPCRSKPVPDNVRDSRPSSSLATPKGTSVSGSRRPRKWPRRSAPPLSLRS